jgi:hypothetical protein
MTQDEADLQALEGRINAILPPQYQGCFESVPPTSMGSASLKFGPDGRVAWDEIWTTFCHLALAGGPPHRGTLLEAVAAEEALADPAHYHAVAEEIARGIRLTTQLSVVPGKVAGWVGIRCYSEEMAAWLLRAVVAENISAYRDRNVLYVPAGPRFRLEKEIKNVVTTLAKTHHYWDGHLPAVQRHTGLTATLLEPALPAQVAAAPERYRLVVATIAEQIGRNTGMVATEGAAGWVGVECVSEEMAVWLMRAVLVENILVRHEDDVLFLPAGPAFETEREIKKLVAVLTRARQLWDVRASGGIG